MAVVAVVVVLVILGQQNQKKKELMPAVRIELTTFRSFKDSLKEEYFIYEAD